MSDSRRALVVGAASGIGRRCAAALADAGWEVAAADVVAVESGHGVSVSAMFDVRDFEAVEAGIARLADGGRFDAVVHAAGFARVAALGDISPRNWAQLVEVNLNGAFHVLRAAIPWLRDGASVVLISSIDGQLPVSGLGHYCASKAGVEALARSAALELGPRGIRCNVIAPGAVATPMMTPLLDRPEVAEAFTSRTPLGRIGTPADIADVVAFLVSPSARWITGARIPVDGGLSLREHPSMLPFTVASEPERKPV